MGGISRSRRWDKEIPHGDLPMEQLVLSDKWARKKFLTWVKIAEIPIQYARKMLLHLLNASSETNEVIQESRP